MHLLNFENSIKEVDLKVKSSSKPVEAIMEALELVFTGFFDKVSFKIHNNIKITIEKTK